MQRVEGFMVSGSVGGTVRQEAASSTTMRAGMMTSGFMGMWSGEWVKNDLQYEISNLQFPIIQRLGRCG